MILYDASTALRLTDYGILIPVLKNRADIVLSRLRERQVGPESEWLRSGVTARLSREDLERVHDRDYVERLFDRGPGLEAELLKTYELIGVDGKPNRYEPASAERPLSDLFDRILRWASGTYEACGIALEAGFAYYLGGGMHHARRDGGSGFCLLNDLMIAVARMRTEGRVGTVWIVDVDAHKGDGTAEIALRDPDTYTLSVHMADGWPLDPESLAEARREKRGRDRAPLAPSDVDIGIRRGEDDRYLERLSEGLKRLEKLSGKRKPDLAIVEDGADPYVHDGLASSADLALSLEQCVARDFLIRDFLRARGIPSAWLMSGGYGERSWEPPAAFLEALSRERSSVESRQRVPGREYR